MLLLGMPFLNAVVAHVCIVLACASRATGLCLMKAAPEKQPGVSPWRSKYWVVGFFLGSVLGSVMDLYVLAVLPLSIVAPFAGLTIVFSLALARSGVLSKREFLTKGKVLAATVTLLGITLVATFGPREEKPPTGAELLNELLTPPFFCLLGMAYGTAALRLTGLVKHPALSAFAAACCGCIAQLATKLFAGTLGTLLSGGAAVLTTAPILAAELVALVGNSVLQLTLLNFTLESPLSLAVPLYQSLLLLVASAAGGIIFHEFDSCPTLGLYFIGVLVSLLGLAVASCANAKKAHRGETPRDAMLPNVPASDAASEVTPSESAASVPIQARAASVEEPVPTSPKTNHTDA